MQYTSLTLHHALEMATQILKRAHMREASGQAQIIAQGVLGLRNRSELILQRDRKMSRSLLHKIQLLSQKRARRIPIQYLLGHTDFYHSRFQVRRGCLIPRPETEILTDAAIVWLKLHQSYARRDSPLDVLDMGIGSGNISCSIAEAVGQVQVTGVDRSLRALKIARENILRLGLDPKINLIHSDFFRRLPASRKFDLIVSNPPYIARDEIQSLPDEIKKHEPHLALNGGGNGLDAIRRLILNAPRYLNDKGALMFEFGGRHQTRKIIKMIQQQPAFKKYRVLKDLAKKDRVFLLETSHG